MPRDRAMLAKMTADEILNSPISSSGTVDQTADMHWCIETAGNRDQIIECFRRERRLKDDPAMPDSDIGPFYDWCIGHPI
jgi:hypothetical protein